MVVEEEGEIISGGYGLAIDYLGNEVLTNEKFRILPTLGRVYRTGDRGILTKDGLIEIRGRMDNQIKLNGFRIELEEVEKCLNSIRGVYQSVTCVYKKNGSDVLSAGIKLTEQRTVEEIKEELAQIIPDYSMPHDFILLEELPLSPNRKVDRKAFYQISRDYLERER